MRIAGTAFAALASVLLAGCFDLEATSNNRVVRLNRVTGQVTLIRDSVLLPVRPSVAKNDSASPGSNSLATANSSRARTWPIDSLPNLGVKYLRLATRCRSGRLAYRIGMSPVPRRYESSGLAPFTLHIEDSAGFRLVSEQISAGAVTRLVDDTGKATGLEVNGNASLSDEDCTKLAVWGLSWRL